MCESGAAMTESRQSDSPERIHIAGTIRWALTDRGRIIVQFATHEDLIMALDLVDRAPMVVRHEGNTIEYQLPE